MTSTNKKTAIFLTTVWGSYNITADTRLTRWIKYYISSSTYAHYFHKMFMSTVISCFVWRVCINFHFRRLKLSASVNSRVLCSLEYVIVTFSARIELHTYPLSWFRSALIPLQVAVIVCGALKWLLKFFCVCSLRDLEKQLTFQKGFKEHDNSLLPGHILWTLEYFY